MMVRISRAMVYILCYVIESDREQHLQENYTVQINKFFLKNPKKKQQFKVAWIAATETVFCFQNVSENWQTQAHMARGFTHTCGKEKLRKI